MKILIPLLSSAAVFMLGGFSLASASQVEWVACTMEYAPVCAQVQVQCVRAPCYPIYKTYSNACEMGTETTAQKVHDGECTAFEGSTPVVLSEGLKKNLQIQFDRFFGSLSWMTQTIQLQKLHSLDSRINDRLAIPRSYPMTLEQEMQADKMKYALEFIQDITKTNIQKLEESITGKRYLFRDTNKCAVVKFKCMAGESYFSDDIGCGCQK